jgi:hypothetical protein
MGVRVGRRKDRPSDEWWLFVDYKGRRTKRRFGRGKKAKVAADALAVQLKARLALGDSGVFENERRAELTFKELAEEWLAKYPLVNSISQTTVENYTSFTRKHLIPYFGTLPVSAITPEKVEDFIAAKRNPGGSARFDEKPLSESSLRTGLITLRLILQRAVKAKLLPGNPAVGVGSLGTMKRRSTRSRSSRCGQSLRRRKSNHGKPRRSSGCGRRLACGPARCGASGGATWTSKPGLWPSSGLSAGAGSVLRRHGAAGALASCTPSRRNPPSGGLAQPPTAARS